LPVASSPNPKANVPLGSELVKFSKSFAPKPAVSASKT